MFKIIYKKGEKMEIIFSNSLKFGIDMLANI